ncbi:MAG: flagellar biosynthetic protein FliO [Clostridiales bacterium]|nr:flagellar biosynthetic protein FliO [Clostridiales bacterium]
MNIYALSGIDGAIKFITLLILFAFVLAITYFVTRWIGGYQKQHYTKGNIEIIEARQISTNKYIYVARIGSEYFAIASGKESMNVIGKLDKEGLVFPEPSVTKPKDSFQNILDKVKNLKQTKK